MRDKNRGFCPHLPWYFTHAWGLLPHRCRSSRPPHPSQESLAKRPGKTITSKGSLFLAPKLRDPRLERHRQGRGQGPRQPCPQPSYAAMAASVVLAHAHRTPCVSTLL